MKGHCFLPRPRSRRPPHQAWAPFLLLGVPPRPAAYRHGQLQGRGGQQGPPFVYHPLPLSNKEGEKLLLLWLLLGEEQMKERKERKIS